MIELTTPTHRARDFFAANPNPMEAEEAAMGWLDALEEHESNPERPIGGLQGEAALKDFLGNGPAQTSFSEDFQDALSQYEEFSLSQGREPFSLADAVIRKRDSENDPQRFSNLQQLLETDDDEDFIERAQSYGLDTEGYRKIASPELRQALAVDIAVRELYGFADQNSRDDLAAQLNLPIFDIEQAASFLPGFLHQKQTDLDALKLPRRKAFEDFFSQSPINADRSWIESMSPKVAEHINRDYIESLNRLGGRYGAIRHLVRPIAEEIKTGKWFDIEGPTTGLAADYFDLSPEHRTRLWEALALVAQEEGEDIDGWFTNTGIALGRSIENIGDQAALYWTRESSREAEAALSDENATPKEKILAKSVLGRRQLDADMRNHRELFRSLDKEQWLSTAISGSLPHFLFMANPVSAGVGTVPSYIEGARERLAFEKPDLDSETLDNLSVGIGAAQAGLERVGFLAVFGRGKRLLPKKWADSWLAKLGSRIVSGGLTETAEEILQEFSFDAAKAVGQRFDEEIPDAQFGETLKAVIEQAPQILTVGMLFGAIGGSITTARDLAISRNLEAALDAGQLPAALLNPEASKRVLSKSEPLERLATFREEWKKTTPEQRQEALDKLDIPTLIENQEAFESFLNRQEKRLERQASSLEPSIELVAEAQGINIIQPQELRASFGPNLLPKVLADFSITKFLARNLRARSGLTEEQFAMKLATEGVQAADLKRAEQNLQTLSRRVRQAAKESSHATKTGRATEEDRLMKQAQLVLVNKAEADSLPESLRSIVGEARKHIDNLSSKMVNVGITDKDLEAVFRQNMGSYLNRSYRRFTRPEAWKKEVSQDVRNEAKQYLRENLPENSFDRTTDIDTQLDGYVEALLNDEVSGSFVDKMNAVLGQKHLGNLIRRQDIPEPIRKLWGEYTRADENYMNSVRKMAGQIASHTMMTGFREQGLGTLIFETPRKGFSHQVSAEDNRALAPLDGLYVSEELATALKDFANQSQKMDLWLRWFLKFNSTVKVGKTVFNPTTHARNFFSNFLYTFANGNLSEYLLSGGESLRINITEILPGKSDAELEAKIRHYIRLGIMQQGAVSQEFKDVLKDFSAGDIDFEEYSKKQAGNLLKKGSNAIQALYQAEDDFHKIVAFEAERRKLKRHKSNLSSNEIDNEAARIIRNTMPDYSQVPRVVKLLRKFPFMGTFTSFTSEVIRNNKNIIGQALREMKDPELRTVGANRFASFMMAHAVPVAAMWAAKEAFNIDDEEDEAVRALAAPWDKDALLIYSGRTEAGDPQCINLSYTDPFSLFKTPFILGAHEGYSVETVFKGIARALEPFYSGELGATALLELTTNRDDNGREIVNKNADFFTQIEEGAEHLTQKAEPGFVRTYKRIKDASLGKASSSGTQLDLETEVAAVLSGQRVTTVDRGKAVRFRAIDFDFAIRDASARFKRAWRRHDATKEEIVKAHRQFLKDRRKAFSDFQDSLQAAYRLGLDEEQIFLEANDGKSQGRKAERIRAMLNSKPGETYSEQYEFSNGNLDALKNIEGREKILREIAPEFFKDLK